MCRLKAHNIKYTIYIYIQRELISIHTRLHKYIQIYIQVYMTDTLKYKYKIQDRQSLTLHTYFSYIFISTQYTHTHCIHKGILIYTIIQAYTNTSYMHIHNPQVYNKQTQKAIYNKDSIHTCIQQIHTALYYIP